ncbi:MAG: phosphatase PAP2 family protein [bacterium]|nr:phosphatase PAP2 family protein [bacterium]
MLEFLLQLDTQLFYFFNSTLANDGFDLLMPFVTNKRNWILPLALALIGMLVFGSKRSRIAVVLIVLSVATADLLCYRVLKPGFNRTRPSHALADARVLTEKGGTRSFPSNHAANITAAMVMLTFFFPVYRYGWYYLAALVSFSRIYVGVHYPLDVLAGILVGLLISLLWIRVLQKMESQKTMTTIDIIRKIDYWVGIPLCWLMSLFEGLASRVRSKAKDSSSPKNILFIELSEMGSAIIAYSALEKTRELYPEAKLFFLIFAENKESVLLTGAIPKEHVFTIRHKSPRHFVTDSLSVLRKMRALPIDTAVDMELFSRATSLLSYLSGAHRRVGYYNFRMEGLYRGKLLTHEVQYNVYQHMAYNFLNLVYALQASPDELPKLKQRLTDKPSVPRLESTEAEKTRIWKKLTDAQPALKHTDTLIIFNPNAGLLPIRAWPLEKYVELAQRLSRRESMYIVVMGIKDAANDAAAIKAAIGERCIDMTDKTADLREVVDLFNVADVLVTNDSGPAHFASLTPIRNFVFFGPETPDLYAPLGERTVSIFADYSCSPCLNSFNHRNTPCTDARCVKNIPVDEVYEKIVDSLE